MQVSEQTRDIYQKDSIKKILNIYVEDNPNPISMANIVQESMVLKESLLESNEIEFVGCIASSFEIQLHGIQTNLKGKKIRVKLLADGEDVDEIPLFSGIVDSSTMQANRQYKKIIAYDELYIKGQIDVADWYKSIRFPVSMSYIRHSLCAYIGIEEVDVDLPNDDILINKQYDPETLSAIDVLKNICQFNGAFGIINRDGVLEYRIFKDITPSTPYPSAKLFPSSMLFPSGENSRIATFASNNNDTEATALSFYRKVMYEDFTVKPVDKVVIRENEKSPSVTYGSGQNKYIIQGNIFAYKLGDDTLSTVARNIYDAVSNFSYIPYNADNNGLPWLECGIDAVQYTMIDYANSESQISALSLAEEVRNITNPATTTMVVPILNRTMTGIQGLKDSLNANGEEYQNEFVTDLNTVVNTLQQGGGSVDKEEVDDIINDSLDEGGAINDFVSDAFDDSIDEGGIIDEYVNDRLDDYYDKDEADDKYADKDYGYSKKEVDDKISGITGAWDIVTVDVLPSVTKSNTIYLIRGTVVVE